MFEGKRIVVVTPAGRKQYLEILVKYILNLREVVDEYRMWVNTTNDSDIKYMEQLQSEHPDFIKLEYLSVPPNGNSTVNLIYPNCCENNTVYVKLDDDIVMMEGINEFKNFLHFRITNPEYFLVYSNILNNSIIAHIHQRLDNLNLDHGIAGYNCTDDIGWMNPNFSENLHNQVLANELSSFHFGIWKLYHYERVSINCISWLGEEFSKFNGNVGGDEEQWLSCDKPSQIQKMNAIYGGFVCVHYAFFTQRDYLDTTDILQKYKAKCECI